MIVQHGPNRFTQAYSRVSKDVDAGTLGLVEKLIGAVARSAQGAELLEVAEVFAADGTGQFDFLIGWGCADLTRTPPAPTFEQIFGCLFRLAWQGPVYQPGQGQAVAVPFCAVRVVPHPAQVMDAATPEGRASLARQTAPYATVERALWDALVADCADGGWVLPAHPELLVLLLDGGMEVVPPQPERGP